MLRDMRLVTFSWAALSLGINFYMAGDKYS